MLDVKGDKERWVKVNCDPSMPYFSPQLFVDETYYDGIVELIEEQQKEIEELLRFVKDCQTNWDCDSDAHRYDTTCRACDAEKLIIKFTNSK